MEKIAVKRCFFAVPIQGEAYTHALELMAALRANDDLDAHCRFTHPKNLHITLKFLGATRVDRLQAIVEAAEKVAEPLHAFNIKLQEAHWFPPHQAKVLALNVQSHPQLAAIAEALNTVMQAFEFQPETRQYTPHVTLARLQRHQQIIELGEEAAFSSEMHVDRFHLYQTELQPGGSIYTPIKTIYL